MALPEGKGFEICSRIEGLHNTQVPRIHLARYSHVRGYIHSRRQGRKGRGRWLGGVAINFLKMIENLVDHQSPQVISPSGFALPDMISADPLDVATPGQVRAEDLGTGNTLTSTRWDVGEEPIRQPKIRGRRWEDTYPSMPCAKTSLIGNPFRRRTQSSPGSYVYGIRT
jgi:hypothetical protein